jgi:ABC-type long-subunit fatty acid transport system fused permease/ATPase subunit
MNLITGICIIFLNPSRELLDERMRRRCSRFQYFWDRVLTDKHWRFLDNVWFAHTPHLWEKRTLLKIEETLSEQIAVCRVENCRNRFRDPTIDVTMHLQYEALLRSEWAQLHRIGPSSHHLHR